MRSDIDALVAAEHAELCDVARSLSATQWQSPTLCDEWSVRDVAIHVSDHIHRTGGELTRDALRGRLSSKRTTALILTRHRGRSTEEIVEWLDAPVRSPSMLQLAELMIHQQDIRRPLGIPRDISQDRLIPCLDYTLSRRGHLEVAGARRRAHGLHLAATDAPWSWGSGPNVSGPAEAILMAVHGRRETAKALYGEGVATLISRCTS